MRIIAMILACLILLGCAAGPRPIAHPDYDGSVLFVPEGTRIGNWTTTRPGIYLDENTPAIVVFYDYNDAPQDTREGPPRSF